MFQKGDLVRIKDGNAGKSGDIEQHFGSIGVVTGPCEKAEWWSVTTFAFGTEQYFVTELERVDEGG